MKAPGIVGRTVLMVLLALSLAWLAISGAVYLGRGGDEGLTPPRLAAVVLAVEAAGDGEDAVLAGLSAPGLRLRLGETPPERDMRPFPPEALEAYGAELAPRAVEADWVPAVAIGRLIGRGYAAGLPHRSIFHIQLTDGRTLSVSRSAAGVNRAGLPFGFVAGLAGSVIALGLLLLLLREARPVARLAQAADRMAPGQVVDLPDVRRASAEVRALAGAFDRLQHRLQAAMAARSTLFAGISHDVRTFATRLRLRVDSIPDGDERARAEAEIADMIRLLDDALLLGRAETGEVGEELVRPGALAADEVERFRSTGAQVSFAGDRTAAMLGDPLALRRWLANGIGNALSYAGQARVSVRQDGATVRVTVEDDGPGIPEHRRAELLEPFTRGDPSRNRATGGAGLGLAIMRSLTEAMGGRMDIGESPSGGARVSAEFPALDLGD